MRAVRIHEFGGPEKVVVDELPEPSPGPGEALVRVRAAGVNPVDWMVREQIYNPEGADRVPLVLGQDFSGVVLRVGPGSKGRVREGDEVFGEVFGSFAELVVAPVKDLVAKPESVDHEVAAAIPMAGLTAFQVVVGTAKARPGMRFLVHGASGGVGSFAAQFARWREARVVATASRRSFDYLRSIGVEQVVDYERQRFEDEVADVDVVIDPIGDEVQRRSWSVLKRGGMLVNLLGEVDEAAAKKAGVRAVVFGMEYRVRDLETIAGLVAEGLVKPHVTRVMRLEQAREALDLNQQNRSHGKIVLRVS